MAKKKYPRSKTIPEVVKQNLRAFLFGGRASGGTH